MRSISVDWSVVYLLFPLLITLTRASAVAQKYALESYKIHVSTDSGEKIQGVLSGVGESTLYVEDKRLDIIKIPLHTVRKVKLIGFNARPRIVTGAILGGLAAGYTAFHVKNGGFSSNKSPVLFGVTLVMATAGGAGFGALIGKFSASIGRPHFVFRATGDPESVASLYHLLEPFSETFQKDVINNYP